MDRVLKQYYQISAKLAATPDNRLGLSVSAFQRGPYRRAERVHQTPAVRRRDSVPLTRDR